jgi:hypothetical protein
MLNLPRNPPGLCTIIGLELPLRTRLACQMHAMRIYDKSISRSGPPALLTKRPRQTVGRLERQRALWKQGQHLRQQANNRSSIYNSIRFGGLAQMK